MRTRLTSIAIGLGVAALPSTAFAQQPAQDTYSGVLGQQVANTPQGPTNPPGVVNVAPATTPPSTNATAPATTPIASVKPETATKKSSVKVIPFTGFEIALVLAAGLGLLGLGFAIRRASRERPLGI